jgi:dihydrofolate synthase / folylpolyglutamate synthase
LLPVTPAEALAYLHQLSQFGFQPGLDSTRRLAAAVGNPQDRLRFIHVAGTNGKGSTCAFLESMYRAAGFRTGLYTSPHLVRFGERIQVGRHPLPEETLARLVSELRQRMPADLTPTFFEFTTVVALMAFAEAAVDVVLWETGLGGRLDATNIVTPLASVITSIGLDHMQVLGGTVGEIAAEKAGIIKPGVPILTSVDRADALAVIQYRARELDSHCVVVDAAAVSRMTWPVSLLGPHQRVNATLAVVTVRLLRAFLPVSDEHLVHGLANTRWAGRMQVFQRGEQTWLLDGAHNADGVAAFRRALTQHYPERHPVMVLGMLRDKAWREMATHLAPAASRLVIAPVSSPRTVQADELRQALQEARCGRAVRACASVDEALRAVAREPFVAVTGSLYFIGEVLEQLGLADPNDLNSPTDSSGSSESSGTHATGDSGANQRQLNEWAPPPPH